MQITGRTVAIAWLGWAVLLAGFALSELRRLTEASGAGFVLLPWTPWAWTLRVVIAFSPVVIPTIVWRVRVARARTRASVARPS